MTLVLILLIFLTIQGIIFLNTKYFRSNFSLESDEIGTKLLALKRIRNKGNRNV